MNVFNSMAFGLCELTDALFTIALFIDLATYSPNDDHIFEILRTKMTQLIIAASELTRSHYLLIPNGTSHRYVVTVTVIVTAAVTHSSAPICSRNLFAKTLPHERFDFQSP